jgi:Spy/CpxP family protein refolding chaperone
MSTAPRVEADMRTRSRGGFGMKRYAVVATLLAIVLAAVPVLADQAGPKGGRQAFSQKFQQEIGLTDAQMQTIRDIRARQRDAARQIGQSLGQAERALRQIALTGAAEPVIHAKMTEISQLQQQALQLRVDALKEIAPQLTDEQKQKLAQWSPWRGHRRAPQQQS